MRKLQCAQIQCAQKSIAPGILVLTTNKGSSSDNFIVITWRVAARILQKNTPLKHAQKSRGAHMQTVRLSTTPLTRIFENAREKASRIEGRRRRWRWIRICVELVRLPTNMNHVVSARHHAARRAVADIASLYKRAVPRQQSLNSMYMRL